VRTISSFSSIGRAQRTVEQPNRAADRGVTLIEILVAIVLMATVVVSVLVALQVATKASAVDRDQANLYAWLQAASDEVYNGKRTSCDEERERGRGAVISDYDKLVKDATQPDGWASTSATIEVTKVEFLGRNAPDAEFSWSEEFCFEGCPGEFCENPFYTQKVTIKAVAPNGTLVKVMETVKSE
jgi:type II secretory pathway pseudopilin PulG